ncbi:ATP synthase F1 subunit epsilon [Clostridium swellfunianum]|uniref:ATP synthase F1 subunit epsilon n=1 Tax=Clostridium swellfunianum TaxID=1367462 RepID=UPI00202F385D|nr:ATP synthase F1 subunit epsilon [Clostridium swellfunianum]MCM0647557.1 ATP synthase F1 subunit epsilon [Clostridium swellfunianum]
MSEALKLTILTPEREVFAGEVKELSTENELGRLEILSKHMPMITSLTPTVTMFTTSDGVRHKVFTSTGVLKVYNNYITMLIETAEWPEEIDISRAKHAKEEAVNLLHKSGTDHKKAELKLRRALARIKTKH